MSATAKNFPVGKAPARIQLLGDVARPESATHIIEFPGGAIEVSRCSDGRHYWAHILINTAPAFADGSTRERAQGRVVGSRLERGGELVDLAPDSSIRQIAVLIESGATTGDRSDG